MPAWMEKTRPGALDVDLKMFGSHVPNIPTDNPPAQSNVEVNGFSMPR